MLYYPCTPSKGLNISKPHNQISGTALKLLTFFYLPRRTGLLSLCSGSEMPPLGEEGLFTLVSTPLFSRSSLHQNSCSSMLSPLKRYLGFKQLQPPGKSCQHFSLLHFPSSLSAGLPPPPFFLSLLPLSPFLPSANAVERSLC